MKKIKFIDATYTGYSEKVIIKKDFDLIGKNNKNATRISILLYLLLSFVNINVLEAEMQQAEH